MKKARQLMIMTMLPFVSIGLTWADGPTGMSEPGIGDDDSIHCASDPCDGQDAGGGTDDGSWFNCILELPAGEDPPTGNAALTVWNECMAGHFNATTDYYAGFVPAGKTTGPGPLTVGRLDGGALGAICGFDNIDGIQEWRLSLGTPGRIAKYAKVELPQSDGQIFIELNGTAITFGWFGSPSYTFESFNDALIEQIELYGFEVEESDNYVRIIERISTGESITDFAMRLGDGTGQTILAVALEPYNTVDELLCRSDDGEGGFAY